MITAINEFDQVLKFYHKNESCILTFSCSVEGCPRKFKLERTLKQHYESAHVLHKVLSYCTINKYMFF